jgi:hypothetical protein
MAWEWLGTVTTAVVALAGLGANIITTASAQRTQRALVATDHELKAESARRLERRDAYIRFLGDLGAWHGALVPAGQRISQLQLEGCTIGADVFHIGNPEMATEVRRLIETFHALENSFDVVKLVAGDASYREALTIRNHVAGVTFAMLDGQYLDVPQYTQQELVDRCTQEMSIDLGYRRPAAK